jgi:hypothetical protein
MDFFQSRVSSRRNTSERNLSRRFGIVWENHGCRFGCRSGRYKRARNGTQWTLDLESNRLFASDLEPGPQLDTVEVSGSKPLAPNPKHLEMTNG